MRTCDKCGSRMAPFLPRTRLEDGSLVCKGCANRDDTPTPASHPKRGGYSGGGRAEDARPPAKVKSARSGQKKAEAEKESETEKTAAVPDHYRVLVLDRGEEVPIVVWSGHDPAECMSKAMEEQDDPETVNVYIDRLRGAMGRYEVIWRNGEPTEHFAEGSKTASDENESEKRCTCGAMDYNGCFCGLTPAEWVADRKARNLPLGYMGSRRVAHDSGDGETIYHCPFCGAGQVVARSDGTAECGFCQTAFTVQVQPNRAAVPQTIDGVPHVHPDMPGTEPGTVPDEVAPEEEATETALTDQEQDDSNAIFAKRYYLTSEGSALDEDAYVRHLAIRHAEDRQAVIAAVRAERQDRG